MKLSNFGFLSWIADRLVNVYKESPNVDFVHRLRKIAVEFSRLESVVAMWRARAVREARWRIKLAKEKKRLTTINQNLQQRVDKNFADWLEVSEDRHLWKISHGRVVQENEELLAAIQRLPEPLVGFGDGPDERVGWILQECEAWKKATEKNLRFTQHIQAKLEETTKMGEELIDERDEIIQHLTEDLAHERETVTFLDASFDIRQRLVVAEATLEAIRERAERIQEGEPWNLVSFVLKKIPVKHAPYCWKNISLSALSLGVGGDMAGCTCGAERN